MLKKPYYHDSYCKLCRRKLETSRRRGEIPSRVYLNYDELKEKICSRCKIIKPIEEFSWRYNASKTKKKASSACKICINNDVKCRMYNLTQKELGFLKTKLKCVICGSNNGDENLHIDHCHKTGKVRDLLCRNCNTAIGLLKDDPNIAIKVYEYLIKHK